MKFDFTEQFVNQVLAVLQEAPVPHRVIDPVLKEFVRQANDKKIQSLEYPVQAEEPRLVGDSNG